MQPVFVCRQVIIHRATATGPRSGLQGNTQSIEYAPGSCIGGRSRRLLDTTVQQQHGALALSLRQGTGCLACRNAQAQCPRQQRAHHLAETQRMLLMVLQERRVTRLGEHNARPVDVKVLAATNADLRQAVRRGRFRADLFARLNPAASLLVPPLRERREDLPALLARTVHETFARGPDAALLTAYLSAAGLPAGLPARAQLAGAMRMEGTGPDALSFAFSERSLAALKRHPFPGNVRELRLLVANACLLSLSDALTAADAGRAAAGEAHTVPIPERLVDELLAGSWLPPEDATARRGESAQGEGGRGAWAALTPRARPRDVSRDLERQLYERLYAETDGDFAAMAEQLLTGDAEDNARRVQLRFNQLGLRVRSRFL